MTYLSPPAFYSRNGDLKILCICIIGRSYACGLANRHVVEALFLCCAN